MTLSPKIDRARRNALKAAGLVVGAVLTTSLPHKQASAETRSIRDLIQGIWDSLPGRNLGPSGGGSCFVKGTQIQTREGYRPIETLAVGDEVAVRFRGFSPIKAMVGHTLKCVQGQWDGNPYNSPVLVRRGALGENLPAADLCLTALHAVYVDGFLMRVGDLVNGTSIALAAPGNRDTLEFFNIELEHHDILDAQGACCESLYREGMERCAPLLGFEGGRSKFRSHLRSAGSLVIDRRQPIDVIRDTLEERGLELARAA